MRSPKLQPNLRKTSALGLLNPQQRMFIGHLMADKEFSATNAAKLAGYKRPQEAAYRLLRTPLVSKEIGRQIANRLKRVEVTADRVILELASIAFSDVRELWNSDGTLKNVHKIKGKAARAISSIKVSYRKGEYETVKVEEIKFWNKMDALTLLAKHLGMVTEKHQINMTGKVEIDYERLYVRDNARRITADVVETLINNPELAKEVDLPTVEKVQYTVNELLEGEEE